MTAVIKSLAGTSSGLCIEYEELLCPNHTPRFWNGKLVQPSLIVTHSAECCETWEAADSLAKWVLGPDRPKASWNFACANADITMSVPVELQAWHAGPVNPYSIGVELAGKASQTAEQWADEYSTQQLTLYSMLTAVLCEIYQIPVRLVTPEELRRNHMAGVQSRGLCGHDTVTQALSGTHTDPGHGFPWDKFVQMVQTKSIGAPDE